MPWLCAIIETAEESVEILSDALIEVGALAVDVQDAAAGTEDERPIFAEPGEAPAAGWRSNRVGALFVVDADLYELVPEALAAAGLAATAAFRIERVEDADWVRLTQSQFNPIKITPRLWIVPSWHTPPDPEAVNIALDPGVAFGTGAHPTTRLCLRWLADTVTPQADVLDYGCGSGILAIAAMKLGAQRACGIDIDPQAVQAAQQNAQQNSVEITWATAEQDVAGTISHRKGHALAGVRGKIADAGRGQADGDGLQVRSPPRKAWLEGWQIEGIDGRGHGGSVFTFSFR